MAEMFLKLDGIEGESLDSVHTGEIEIKDWQWDTINTVKWDINQGGQSTKVDVQHVLLNKFCDKASVTLYQNCVTGKHIRRARRLLGWSQVALAVRAGVGINQLRNFERAD